MLYPASNINKALIEYLLYYPHYCGKEFGLLFRCAPIGHRKQEDFRGLTSKKSSYSLVQILPPYHKELRCLEVSEKQAAQEYGMFLEGQYIDSAAVLQEAKNHARLSSQNHSRLEDLEKLYHLRMQNGSNPRPPVSYEPPTLTQGDPYHVDTSRFWAVLIGIDAYKSNPLHGCVSDALSVKNSLIKDVRMPEK
ncbi:uncharacterized protein ARMOST_20792 [Armillaria ostoyae]|uniref:Uncharacterized protein n=1 Tax=Armillaria ostoyae TaxID=47428 RepID=A0A284S8E3_ARMOS|nr:uncharacterized protein ARMOST_20792 [Armillaria ostoyae]